MTRPAKKRDVMFSTRISAFRQALGIKTRAAAVAQLERPKSVSWRERLRRWETEGQVAELYELRLYVTAAMTVADVPLDRNTDDLSAIVSYLQSGRLVSKRLAGLCTVSKTVEVTGTQSKTWERISQVAASVVSGGMYVDKARSEILRLLAET